ncbi:TetR/AcrR family transcriptional regulator [Cryptosporangium aurantiacum]|uniref:TetR/AcrR family transcriptional regulator n=1 Tax=Cryptosporangium aurantiacum TaxID=134849 RepID=UPI000935120E|nr:TetR/AcrR family transcriptional regulator [Cryptosporangium aurantiacum]
MVSAGRPRGPYAGAAERRAAIVDAAFTVFAAHGYAGGSLQKVADLVGMSQTSLLHYFPKKSDLLLAVLRKRDEMGEVVLPPGGAFIDAVLRQVRANETIQGVIELYTVLAGEAVTRGNPGREYMSRRLAGIRDEYTRKFRDLADAGRLRPGMTPEVAAASLVALWDGLQLQWLLDPDAVDIASHLQSFFDVIVLPAESPAPST